MYAQFGKYMYFRWRIITVLTQNPAVLMFEDITGPQTVGKYEHLLQFQSSGRCGENIQGSSYYVSPT